MSTSEAVDTLRQAARTLGAEVERDGAAEVPLREMQELFALLVRAYAARRENVEIAAPFAPQDEVSATDVAVTATGMLEAAEMAVFELSMWQTIKGRS